MFGFSKTYSTPSAEQLDELSVRVKNADKQKSEADCAYLLNQFNKLLVESVELDKSANLDNKFSHKVYIDESKLNYWLNLDKCVGTKYDPLNQMKNVGVKVKFHKKTYDDKIHIEYIKADKQINFSS